MTMIETKLPKVGTTIFSVMSQWALQHQAVNLGQGFPDFEPPQELRDALTRAMNTGRNQYAPMHGTAGLREQIALKTARLYGRKLDVDTDITVTSGATEAIFAAIAATVRAGEEVIVFDPAYDCYEPAIELQGARAVHIPLTVPAFSIDWQRVREAITPKTRMILINSPHNPSGAVLSAGDLDELAAIVRDTSIVVLSDEVYEHIVYDGAQHQSVLRHPELAGRLRDRAAGAVGRVPQGAPVPHVLHVPSGTGGVCRVHGQQPRALPGVAGVLSGQARSLPRLAGAVTLQAAGCAGRLFPTGR